MRRVYDIVEEPRDETYRALMEYAVSCCGTALVVEHDSDRSSRPDAQRLFSSLRPFLLGSMRGNSWPGVEGCDPPAVIHKYLLNAQSAEILKGATRRLFRWNSAELNTEDLCLLRPDGSPWLVTMAVDEDPYLEIDESEKREIEKTIPGLRLALPIAETTELGEERAENLEYLKRLFSLSPDVQSHDSGCHDEALQIVRMLGVFERYSREILERYVPRLLRGEFEDHYELESVLLEIHFLLGGISQEISRSRYFRAVLESKDEGNSAE